MGFAARQMISPRKAPENEGVQYITSAHALNAALSNPKWQAMDFERQHRPANITANVKIETFRMPPGGECSIRLGSGGAVCVQSFGHADTRIEGWVIGPGGQRTAIDSSDLRLKTKLREVVQLHREHKKSIDHAAQSHLAELASDPSQITSGKWERAQGASCVTFSRSDELNIKLTRKGEPMLDGDQQPLVLTGKVSIQVSRDKVKLPHRAAEDVVYTVNLSGGFPGFHLYERQCGEIAGKIFRAIEASGKK